MNESQALDTLSSRYGGEQALELLGFIITYQRPTGKEILRRLYPGSRFSEILKQLRNCQIEPDVPLQRLAAKPDSEIEERSGRLRYCCAFPGCGVTLRSRKGADRHEKQFKHEGYIVRAEIKATARKRPPRLAAELADGQQRNGGRGLSGRMPKGRFRIRARPQKSG